MAATKRTKKPTKARKLKKLPPSSTGKVRGVVANQTNWRQKMQTSRIKFDDDAKQVYLEQMRSHGLKGRSAEAVGVGQNTVISHIKNDPDFAEEVTRAIQTYADKIVTHHQNLVLNGVITLKYDKLGNVVEKKHDYPIRLIELELKKVDPAYRDHQILDVKQAGGVLVAPAHMTPEEWIKKAEKDNETALSPEERETAEDSGSGKAT